MQRAPILFAAVPLLFALGGCEAIERRNLAKLCAEPLDMPAQSDLRLAPQAELPGAVPLYPGAKQQPRSAGARGAYAVIVQPFDTMDSPGRVIDFYRERLKAAGRSTCDSVVYGDRFGQIRSPGEPEIIVNVRGGSGQSQGVIEVYTPRE